MTQPDKAALLPCPFCGATPDINDPNTFQTNQGTKWGFVVCCCNGPEVRTAYHATNWHPEAIASWNTRSADGLREAIESGIKKWARVYGIHLISDHDDLANYIEAAMKDKP